MSERFSHMNGGLRRKLPAALLIVIVAFIPLAMDGQSSSPSSANEETSDASSSLNDGTSGGLLPRNYVVTLRLVRQLFPQIGQASRTGRDLTAPGMPLATRAVFFTSDDGSKLVTVSVDQYGSAHDALVAYREAVDRSKAVPGFRPISLILNLGQAAFAGTSTQGDETHVGLGVLDGTLILGATLAGFPATLDNFIDLVALARAEDAASNAAR